MGQGTHPRLAASLFSFVALAVGGGLTACQGGASGGKDLFHGDPDPGQPYQSPNFVSGGTRGEGGLGLAVGSFGAVLTLQEGVWALEDLGFALGQNLHGSWIDDEGGLWAVGGQTFAPPYTEGILLHRGTPIPNGGL